MTRKFDAEYFESMADLPTTDIAGMVMFDALIDALRAADAESNWPEIKHFRVLRRIAKQAKKIAEQYDLDHNIDLDRYFEVGFEEA